MDQQQILVVGNGVSVLDHKLGKIIDEGPWSICRFNNFQTEGFSEYVGTRTNILCRRSCDDVKLWDSDDLNQVFTFITYCKWTAGMSYVARDVQAFYGSKCQIIGVRVCREIGELIKLDQPEKEWASVGFLGVNILTKLYGRDRIVLHGFDEPINKGRHYFKKPPRDACYHNWQKEYEYINSLGLEKLEFV